MNIDPTPLVCSQCGEPPTLEHLFASGGAWCLICGKTFCARHLIIRNGVPNCAGCEAARRIREQTGGVSDEDEARVVRLILQDLSLTVGPGHEAVVQEAAARMRLFSDGAAELFEQRVVDDVQQYLHDTFVDTTWPSCPHHPNHPLWYSEQGWTCEQSGIRIARLGELAAGRDTM